MTKEEQSLFNGRAERLDEYRKRVAELESQVQKQTEHQIQSDLRIQNQKAEIHRRETEYASVVKRLENFERWKRESEQWADKDSAFWKIHELQSHLAALLLAGEPFEKLAEHCAEQPDTNHALVALRPIRALAAALEKAREGMS